MYSIIDGRIVVNDELCVLSIAHDANSEKEDYYHAAIILEKISSGGQHVIQLFEPEIIETDQSIQLMVKTKTPEFSLDAFKKHIDGKDYYAVSFSVLIVQVNHLNTKLEQGLEKRKELFSREKPSFFSSGMAGHPDETSAFAWVRELMVNTITSQSRKIHIPENIPSFKKESKNIGALSSPKQCLVM